METLTGDKMEQVNVAIVGLGRVGRTFLEQLLGFARERGVNILYVVEKSDTPGKQLARDAGITVLTLPELCNVCSGVDIIFDFTGKTETRREMMDKLSYLRNKHTVIISEKVARLMWAIMGGKALPERL
jgi:lactate dehydrogenase-like 2-hydroxyacid dehydrogenase